MEFKGTKGKWELFSTGKNVNGVEYSTIGTDEQGVFIEIYDEPHEVNALLISKAPEMLEMLQKIVLMTDVCDGSFKDFRERYNIEIKQLIKEATEL